MAVSTGPVVLTTVGDQYVSGARILAIVWEGATTSGDTVEVRDRVSGAILWPGRTDTTQTYQGIQFGQHGMDARNGFVLTQRSSGRVLVYLRED